MHFNGTSSRKKSISKKRIRELRKKFHKLDLISSRQINRKNLINSNQHRLRG